MSEPSPAHDQPTKSKEELLAELEDLHRRAVDLRDRVNAQYRVSPLVVAARLAFLVGVPVLVGLGVYTATDSVLFSVLALFGAFVLVVAIVARVTPSPPGPGTRAWESEQTVRLIDDVIAARREDQLAMTDDAERARIDREIEFLREQREDHARIAMSGDKSPGSGSIGFTPYDGD